MIITRQVSHQLRRHGRPLAAIPLAALVLAACTTRMGFDQASSASPASSALASAAPSSGGGEPGPAGFYLRAWETQALGPRESFTVLPLVTIADGKVIDGRVAVPAIYPGPLFIDPSSRPITARGEAAVLAAIRGAGLLGDASSFGDGPPLAGGSVAHLRLVVEGRTYELTGDPTKLLRCTQLSRCGSPDPGSAPAFAALWQRLSSLDGWLAGELGAPIPYAPARLAVLTVPPASETSGLHPGRERWPLAMPLAAFGVPFGGSTDRCATVAGEDLAALLPGVKAANALTRFADATATERSLIVRVLVPGEPDPCAAAAG